MKTSMLLCLLSSLASCGSDEPAAEREKDSQPAESSDLIAPVSAPVQLGHHIQQELRLRKHEASKREDVLQQAIESNR